MTTKPHGFQPTSNRRGMLRLMWGGAAGTAAAGLGIEYAAVRPDPDHVLPADYVHPAIKK